MKIKKKVALSGLLLCCAITAKAQVCITPQVEQRARELVSQMTLEEKIDYISGPKSFYIRAVPRLGIPEIRMADGPQGIRNNTQSTLYPCGILSASTWNRKLARELGHGLARDAKARGVSILLGPGVNIYRSPLCGRNYEYFGEDPYLTGETAKEYILGVQEEGVMATVKHFAANNQEWSRHHASSDVDERTLQEIYFPAFRKAVQEAGVGAVMDSYNPLNGVHATENSWLNIDVLRKQWGFKGILMSDWTSVYSGVGAANGGLDLEMPVGKFMTREILIPAIENGIVKEETIDAKVRHILQTLIAFGALDTPREDKSIDKDNAQSKEIALDLAREGVVLLKNDNGTLPYRNGRTLVIGPNADIIPTGGGSGFVTPYSVVSLYDGMVQLKGGRQIELLSDSILYKDMSQQIYTDGSFTQNGFKGEYYNTRNLTGELFQAAIEPAIDHAWKYGAPFDGMPVDQFSARWTGVYKADQDGIVSVNLQCADLYLNKTIDLVEIYGAPQTEYELSYSYDLKRDEIGERFTVKVTVTDAGGREVSQDVLITMDGDFENPTFTIAPGKEVTVLIKDETKFNLNFTVKDDRILDYVLIEIPGVEGFESRRIEAGGQSTLSFTEKIILPNEVKSYDVTLTAVDARGNQTVTNSTISVSEMPDFPKMYLADVATVEELNSDIFGVPMVINHTGEYQYRARYYNKAAGTEIFFLPQKTDFTPICFGLDPEDNTKLTDDPETAKPIVLDEAGVYYEIDINVKESTYSMRTYSVTEATNPMKYEYGKPCFDRWENGESFIDFYIGWGGSPQDAGNQLFAQDKNNPHLFYYPENGTWTLEAGEEMNFIISNYHPDGWWDHVEWRCDDSQNVEKFGYFSKKGDVNPNWEGTNQRWEDGSMVGDNWMKPTVTVTGNYRFEFDAHLGRGKIVPAN